MHCSSPPIPAYLSFHSPLPPISPFPFPSPTPYYPHNPLSLSLPFLPLLLTPTILSPFPLPSPLSFLPPQSSLPFPSPSPFYPHNPLSLSLSLTFLPLLTLSSSSLLPILLSVLPPPPPCRVLHEVAAMNNYFGIGFDAKIMYEFRTRREENPKQYTSVLPTHIPQILVL